MNHDGGVVVVDDADDDEVVADHDADDVGGVVADGEVVV